MKNLLWTGAVMDPSGYGEATRGYLAGLGKLDTGLNIKVKPRYFFHGQSVGVGNNWPMLKAAHENDFDRDQPYVYLQHLTPDQWNIGYGNNVYHIGMTTFETDSIPRNWLMQMKAMDEIWTFSNWSRNVMRSSGIRNPIKVIPHGVNTERFNPTAPPLAEIKNERLMRGGQTFVFGSNFDWTERKNPRALLKAYINAFGEDDDVMLVLKAYHQYPLERSGRYIREQIEGVRAELGKRGPSIMLLPPIMPANLLPAFYTALDCYVLPSRGEGWGLTYSEAMASGVPTIAVNWSGHTEFMNTDNSLLLDDYTLKEISVQDAGHQRQYIGHRWADCNVDMLTYMMRGAFESRDTLRVVGRKAAEDMKQWTWDAAAKKADDRLQGIFSALR